MTTVISAMKKSIKGDRKLCSGRMGVGVCDLNIVAREDLSKLIFESIPERAEGVSQELEISSAKALRWEYT